MVDETLIKDEKVNAIESALQKVEGQSPEISKELFLATPEDIVLKTDIVHPEGILFSSLNFVDNFLVSCGIQPLYSKFTNDLKFHHVSLDRQSRKEFVDVSTRKMNNFQVPAEFDKISESRT